MDEDGHTALPDFGAPSYYTVENSALIPNPTKTGYYFNGWEEWVDGYYIKDIVKKDGGYTIPQ
jgi:hypothetical protein